jgi:hypothetical protein
MDDKEFKRKLSEVAVWRIEKVSNTAVKEGIRRARGKFKPVTEDEPEPDLAVKLEDGCNPTMALTLVGLLPCATNCEDCGVHCPNGREVTAKLYPSRTLGKHWRKRCVTCQRYLNKDTGKYTVPGNDASNHYSTKLSPGHQVSFENDQEIITINCENTQAE